MIVYQGWILPASRGLNRDRSARPNIGAPKLIGVDAGTLTVAQSSPCWGFTVVGRLAEGQNGPRGARPPAPVASDG